MLRENRRNSSSSSSSPSSSFSFGLRRRKERKEEEEEKKERSQQEELRVTKEKNSSFSSSFSINKEASTSTVSPSLRVLHTGPSPSTEKKKTVHSQLSSPRCREIRSEHKEEERKEEGEEQEVEEEGEEEAFICHQIGPGDTLLSIALQYDVSIPQLMLQNRLSSTDISFKRELIIPLKRKKKKKAKEEDEKGSTHSKTHQEKEHVHPSRSFSGVCTPQPSSSSSLCSSSFSSLGETKRSKGQDEEERRDRREKKDQDTKEQQPGSTFDREYRDGGIPTSIHRSAYTAMMASSLVLQEDVDIQLVRAQLAFRNGDVEAARVDCRLLHRWKETVGSDDFSVPEVLAYLTVHDGDVQKAWRAMRIDTLHKRRNAALRRGEEDSHTSGNTSRSAGIRGSLSSLFLSHRPSLFGSSPASSARYFRLQDDSSIYFDDPSSSRNPTSPTIIGKRSSSSISSSSSSSSSSSRNRSEFSFSSSIPMSEMNSRHAENEKSHDRHAADLITGQSTCLPIVEESSSSSIHPTSSVGERERERRLQGSKRDKKKDERQERGSKREDTLPEQEQEEEDKRISILPYGLSQHAPSSTASDGVRKIPLHERGKKQIYLEMSEL
ncbi:hypothetical protein CSUI_003753 [Cystoisospora suis]|uniref:LysM domain-containing protein n=1 Tax=Cystoisospora suis TaxID=483139 RepID=A0A2C6L332_9APIC|nr:hypothetical protein CSUI_003753 [Cystoisospora suis]